MSEMDKETFETCLFCEKKLSTMKILKRHLQICKKNPYAEKSVFPCSLCDATFSRKDTLAVHSKTCNASQKKKKMTECLFSECKMKFFHKGPLLDHLKIFHHQNFESEQCLSFKTESEFSLWKEKEEERTFSYFSKASFCFGAESNFKTNYYYCQHDGSSRAHRKIEDQSRATSRKNKVGQIKQDSTCISKIVEKISTGGSREVIYYPAHNHPLKTLDLVHHPVSVSTNNFINNQISLNVPAMDILHTIQSNLGERGSRSETDTMVTKNLVISKRLIQQRIPRKKNAARLHPEDILSVCMKVDLLRKEEYDPVIIFKPTGTTSIEGSPLQFEKELFMLGIQTEEQKKLMVQEARKILIVDDTHCVTQYENVKLLNFLVTDESNKGWPVAHFITNQMTFQTISHFVSGIKNRLLKTGESLVINCIITDDDNALINGIESGMGLPIPHILCQWHLDNAFKDNIRSKCPREMFDETYTDLKLVVTAKTEEECNTLLSAFQNKYSQISPSFLEYLESHYIQRIQKWALCFRRYLSHGNINTTAHVESFHNKLKKVYFKRLPNKRMDDLVNVLLEIEQDDFIARQRQSIIGFSVDDHLINQRHCDGIKLPDSCIIKIFDGLWSIDSITQRYHIHRISQTCSRDLCFDKCNNISCPQLCSHLYTCSCKDNQKALCKHIHKVHSLIHRGLPATNQEKSAVEFYSIPFPEVTSTLSDPNSRVPCEENIYKSLKDDLEKLSKMVDSKDIPRHLLTSVATEIRNQINKCVTLSSTGAEVTSISKPKEIAARQKLITQNNQTLNPLKRKIKKKNQDLELKSKAAKQEAAKENLFLHCL